MKKSKKIVWRCINRLENGTRYCAHSLSADEDALHGAIVRAVNRFGEEDSEAYRTLMKVSLNEALGLNGCGDEKDFLARKAEGLNLELQKLVNEAVSAGKSIEETGPEFKELSDEINRLNSRIAAIESAAADDPEKEERLKAINERISELQSGISEYDDSLVRQQKRAGHCPALFCWSPTRNSCKPVLLRVAH